MLNNPISLREAINLISDTILLCKDDRNTEKPYFFIVGAGISIPEIKSATGIVNDCMIEVSNRYASDPDRHKSILDESISFKSDPMQNYSYWLKAAYPNKINRKSYFKKIIENAKISASNLLLAQIIASKRIATTVFTTNFDDKLRQALDLMGVKDMFIADNPMDNLAINNSGDQIQIAHLHGTYHFYDCCNLSHEIEQIQKQNEITSARTTLQDFLKYKAPIVIGYSGWENDVIMGCIRDRIKYSLPYKMIWFCYSRIDYLNLPNWLKECNDVAFVLPFDDLSCTNQQSLENISFINKDSNDTLSAEKVLHSIISKLKVDTPIIFTNPYKYYSDMLNNLLPQHEDVLHLRRWADRLSYIDENKFKTEQSIIDLELASNKKDYPNVLLQLRKLERDVSIRHGDCSYVLKKVIFPLFKTFQLPDEKELCIDLQSQALSFIKKKVEYFQSPTELKNMLGRILNYLPTRDEEKIVTIIDDILVMTENREDLLAIQILALGIKSTISMKEKKIELLDKMLELSKGHEHDEDIVQNVCLAMLQKINVISIVEEKFSIFDSLSILIKSNAIEEHIYCKYLAEKSIIAHLIEDPVQKLDWMISSINEFDGRNLNAFGYYYLSCVNEMVYQYENSDQMKTSLLAVSNKAFLYEKEFDFSNCEVVYSYIVLKNSFSKLLEKDSSEYIECLRSILTIAREFLNRCNNIICEVSSAIYRIISTRNSDVRIEEKIDYLSILKSYNKKGENYAEVYKASIYQLLIIGKKSDMIEKGFGEDVEIIETYLATNAGYDAYSNGNFDDAESNFLYVYEGKASNEYKENAANNLAFMKRRNETTHTKYGIFELLSIVPVSNGFRCVNTMLCYLRAIECEANWESAISSLISISREDINKVLDWWNKVDIVGEAESQVVLWVINSIFLDNATIDSIEQGANIARTKGYIIPDYACRYILKIKQNLSAA